MPIYEFECSTCNTREELILTIAESEEEIKCPRCNKNMIRVVFSQSTFILKGGGWAASGYSNANN